MEKIILSNVIVNLWVIRKNFTFNWFVIIVGVVIIIIVNGIIVIIIIQATIILQISFIS